MPVNLQKGEQFAKRNFYKQAFKYFRKKEVLNRFLRPFPNLKKNPLSSFYFHFTVLLYQGCSTLLDSLDPQEGFIVPCP